MAANHFFFWWNMQANIPTASTNDVGQKLQSGKIALQEGSKLEMSFLSCKSKKSDMFRSVDKICSGDSWRQPTFPLTGAFTQSLHNLFMSFTMCFGATETRSQLDRLLRSAAKDRLQTTSCITLFVSNFRSPVLCYTLRSSMVSHDIHVLKLYYNVFRLNHNTGNLAAQTQKYAFSLYHYSNPVLATPDPSPLQWMHKVAHLFVLLQALEAA